VVGTALAYNSYIGVIMEVVNLPTVQIKQQVTPEQKAAIHKAAQEFEAVFLTQMLKPMFETTEMNEDPAFGGSREEAIFKSMMLDEFGKGISKGGGVGIAEHVEKELLRLQEMAQ
jgi:flagellar protein FlgJ